MDNNEKLAQVYQPHLRQILVLFPIVWCHEDGGGDWYVRHVFRLAHWPYYSHPIGVEELTYRGIDRHIPE